MKISAILIILFAFLSIPQITSAATIKINEFYAAGSTSSNPDWVEVYNEGFDISLYQLIDAANNKKDLVNSSCNGNFCTIDWYNSLNNSGDTVKLVLKTSPDTSIDEVTYPGNIAVPSSGQSAGRNPDGTGGWVIFLTPTKGSANTTSTPTPTPVSSPTPSPTSAGSTSSSSSSSFTISNTPSQVNSDQSFTVSVSLSIPNNPNSTFYLKGAFKKVDSSNYFGLTKVSGNWIKNGSNYSSQYSINTDSSGNWSGNLEIQPDSRDSGFTGSGYYIFKVGRYTSTGSGPTWSNESNIQITALENTDQGGISSDNSSSTTAPSSSPKSEQSARSKTTLSSQSKSYDRLVYHSATVAAATVSANSSPIAEVKSPKKTNYFSWAGVLMIISGTLVLAFVYLRSRNLTDAIFNFFRKRN